MIPRRYEVNREVHGRKRSPQWIDMGAISGVVFVSVFDQRQCHLTGIRGCHSYFGDIRVDRVSDHVNDGVPCAALVVRRENPVLLAAGTPRLGPVLGQSR